MTIEEQLWEALCKRVDYASIDTIARRAKLNKSTVRSYLLMYYKKGLLDMKPRKSDNVNQYKIKD
jgi:DNA-binding transcriptional ArsR family regulator